MKPSRQQINIISCEDALKRVYDYIDNHLRGKSLAKLEHHLETCRHCFDRVEFEKLLKSRLQKLNLEADSKSVRKRVESLLNQF